MTHFDHLAEHIPDLSRRRMLDLGSGRGKFLVDALKRGAHIVGLEKNPDYIAATHERASLSGVTAEVVLGVGEKLPFPDAQFDFINMGEVVEHVEHPEDVLREVRRILAPQGFLYVSAPSRFGLKDPHYHLYFVNWIPRGWSARFISLFGKRKDEDGKAGRQALHEMHYYTRRGILDFLGRLGFVPEDIREIKLRKIFGGSVLLSPVLFVYRLFGQFFFDTFHILARPYKI